jgi:hypothetical protein
MADPRLDRVAQFDLKSRMFGIRAMLPPKAPRSYTWRGYRILDQGREGACVGFGWAHELLARPVVIQDVSEQTALDIYHRAQQLDDEPGENYSGTSVLAGAKAVSEKHFLDEYRWGFNLDDLVLTLGYHGPVVLGVNWYTGMMDTDPEGVIHKTGQVEGGHCVLADSVKVGARMIGGPNSWGYDWGISGRWTMSFDDMEALLAEQGEQCIPVRRAKG